MFVLITSLNEEDKVYLWTINETGWLLPIAMTMCMKSFFLDESVLEIKINYYN